MEINIKKVYKIIIFMFIILTFFTPIRKVKADLYDDCNQLSEEDKIYIENKIDEYEENHKYNVLVRFYEQSGNIDYQIDNWYNNIYDSLEFKSSVIFAINMRTRETLIIAYDKLSYANFNDNSNIVLQTSNYLRENNYKECIDYFLSEINSELQFQKLMKSSLMVLINLVIFNLIFFFITRTYGQKDTTVVSTYMNPESKIKRRENIFIRKTVSKTKKSSSSSGGRSGGGHSHGRGGHGHF